jgi:uncharacterized protein YceK
MIIFRKILLFILSTLLTCGCSTLFIQQDKTSQYSLFVDPGVLCSHYPVTKNDVFPIYYGGVSLDFYIVFMAPFADNQMDLNGWVKALYPFAVVYSAIDLPFSLIADTFIFPYNYYVLSNCYVIEDGKTYSRWSEGSKYRICSTPKIEKIRDEFQKLYDQKDYVQARAKLEAVVKTCSNRTNFATLGWIRNDLAITMYKLGDYSGCLDVLQPLQEYADEAEKDIQSKYVSMYGPQFGPKVAEDARRLAKTTRANLKLCNRVP